MAKGQHMALTASDGHIFSAYVATPEGTPRGGIVVIQEIFGVNSHIRSVADRLAAAGYLAIAPALFDRIAPATELGYDGEDMARAKDLKARSGNEKPLLDIEACIAKAQSAGKVGMVGFCWGGLLTWLAAGTLPGLSAAVVYYGGGITQHADLKPRCPVLAHFGEHDPILPVNDVRAFGRAHPEVELHLYDATHGFNCDQRASYDAPSSTVARERTMAFFAQHLMA